MSVLLNVPMYACRVLMHLNPTPVLFIHLRTFRIFKHQRLDLYCNRPPVEHGLLRKSELTVRVSLLPVAESIDKHLSSTSGKISSRNFSPRHETQEGEYSSEQKRPGSSILFGNDWIEIFIL
ncbi:hypothetical protein AVEN_128004-1 [Araneus ventricosus]|uniref:Uncharacterized protein n=1 Tax=Araneus ventricosus TaxID=182803 RepID=A0A4Y1ZZF7_ARAVE|nr:hypothetical protein AVEN_128004-1 [Araneus ventricosus]